MNPTVCVATTMESQPIEITQLFFSQALSPWVASKDPYFFPYHNTIVNAALSLWDLGIRERFEIIFDENLIFGPRAKMWYPAILELTRIREPDAAAIMPIDPLFRSDDDFLPIQAADLFAWLLRHGFDNPADRPFPWVLDELTNITETEYSQIYDKERMESVIAESIRQFNNQTEDMKRLVPLFRKIRDGKR